MISFRSATPLLLAALCGCATSDAASPGEVHSAPPAFGVLLMAHGGAPEWNAGVLGAVEPLRDDYSVEVAFGMADAVSIQDAIERLEQRGVNQVAVVRLFISGESWYERTEQILGISEGAPARPAPTDHHAGGGHGGHGGHSMEFWKAETSSSYALSTQGLGEAPAMGPVIVDRARALSRDPATEDVLILAHGPGDDSENERWIANIEQRAIALTASQPFRRVHVETLREDWPEKRVAAEQRIRAFVEQAQLEGGSAIVIPFRVQGFGPYAEVLDGLDYASDGQGLIPHAHVTEWIEEQIIALQDGPFRPALN